MTGLPEYRNGGLFIDTGVLTLKRAETERGIKAFNENAERTGKRKLEVVPMFSPDDDVIVEWRAVTVGFLDLLLDEVNATLSLAGGEKLSLPQMLEAGSWKVCLFFYLIACNILTIHREVGKWPKSAVQILNVHQLPSSATEQSSNYLSTSPIAPIIVPLL